MAADEIRRMLYAWKQEAESKGEEVFYKEEFLKVLYPFLESPSITTAVPLLDIAPATFSYFEKCKLPKQSIIAFDTGILAVLIFETAEEVAARFARAFTSNSKSKLEDVLPQINLELCALYLHLFDRDAFLEAGDSSVRNDFADALFSALSAEVERKLQVDPGDFTEFCNQRQKEFSQYKELSAPWGKLGGTVFWEFGKKLALQYEAYNPAGLQVFILAATDAYTTLREAMNTQYSASSSR